ncbi:MAG: hypothetical protein FJ387_26870 [Verrucomicrobia bacterium]|nr:hypothetical protein [Verrucomicrobiota bacterium]
MFTNPCRLGTSNHRYSVDDFHPPPIQPGSRSERKPASRRLAAGLNSRLAQAQACDCIGGVLPLYGDLPPPIFTLCSGGFFPGLRGNEADELRFINAFAQAGIKLDYLWLDAGWYPCGNDWTQVGTWGHDPARFPRGLKAVSDHVHAKGMGLGLWSRDCARVVWRAAVTCGPGRRPQLVPWAR